MTASPRSWARRVLALLAIAAPTCVGLTLGLSSGAAGAATTNPTGTTTSTVAAYPPSTCETLSVSADSVLEGGTLKVTGTAYTAGQTITLVLTAQGRSWDLATIVIGPSGDFSTTVTMPAGLTGNVLLTVKGASEPSCTIDPVKITILGPSSSSSAGGGGGLASTGVNVIGLVGAGLVLVLAGTALVAETRGKRRPGSHARHAR